MFYLWSKWHLVYYAQYGHRFQLSQWLCMPQTFEWNDTQNEMRKEMERNANNDQPSNSHIYVSFRIDSLFARIEPTLHCLFYQFHRVFFSFIANERKASTYTAKYGQNLEKTNWKRYSNRKKKKKRKQKVFQWIRDLLFTSCSFANWCRIDVDCGARSNVVRPHYPIPIVCHKHQKR